MQERDFWQRFTPPFGEFSWDGQDNWLPQSGRLLKYVKGWWPHVKRYLKGIEKAFESELTRVAPRAWTRPKKYYNLKKVETYTEVSSDDPIATVEQLQPTLASFSPSGATNRQYENVESGISKMLPVLRSQVSRGEHLKIYSKTNRRIRFEVTHNFRSNDRFQFPRKRGVENSTAHRFDSIDEVINFLQRLETRSCEIFREFTEHTSRRHRSRGFHVPPYNALLHVQYHMPSDFDTASTLVSMLVNHKRIVVPASAPEKFREGVRRLEKGLIIERAPRGKSIYVARRPYREAFDLLANHRDWLQIYPPDDV